MLLIYSNIGYCYVPMKGLMEVLETCTKFRVFDVLLIFLPFVRLQIYCINLYHDAFNNHESRVFITPVFLDGLGTRDPETLQMWPIIHFSYTPSKLFS